MSESAESRAAAPLVVVGESVRVTNAPPGLVVTRSERAREALAEAPAEAPAPSGPRRRASLLDVRFSFSSVAEPVASDPPTALVAADRDQAEFRSVEAFAAPPVKRPLPRPSGATFETETMAELYLRQGLQDRALEIFRRLAERAPDDPRWAARIAELEGPEPEPAANAMLADVSFDGFTLPTPRGAAGATGQGTGDAGADDARTARACFGALARRGLSPTASAGRPGPRVSRDDLAAAIAALSTAPLPLGGPNDHAFDEWLRGPA